MSTQDSDLASLKKDWLDSIEKKTVKEFKNFLEEINHTPIPTGKLKKPFSTIIKKYLDSCKRDDAVWLALCKHFHLKDEKGDEEKYYKVALGKFNEMHTQHVHVNQIDVNTTTTAHPLPSTDLEALLKNFEDRSNNLDEKMRSAIKLLLSEWPKSISEDPNVAKLDYMKRYILLQKVTEAAKNLRKKALDKVMKIEGQQDVALRLKRSFGTIAIGEESFEPSYHLIPQVKVSKIYSSVAPSPPAAPPVLIPQELHNAPSEDLGQSNADEGLAAASDEESPFTIADITSDGSPPVAAAAVVLDSSEQNSVPQGTQEIYQSVL
eukprot:TRINITY_DN8769_c0_g1_i1.p1 TRINITY_DN8769_c0_g1~~TRINITY_DN8769_c0_g1_i1.p1  ORF type:complete len:321 (+),score=55.20 TRINITY_DN8769_c0_g1_i1:97-1059(+)